MKSIVKTALLAAAVCLASCTVSEEVEEEDDAATTTKGTANTVTTATGSTYSAEQHIYVDVSGKYSADGSTWTKITPAASSSEAPTVLNDGDTVYYTMYGGSSTDVIRIDLSDVSKKTAVHLSGTMTGGGVKIQTSKTYETGVYLAGVSITSSDFPCIEMTKKGAVSVFLSGDNVLQDRRSYGTGYGEEYAETSGATYIDDDGNSVAYTVTKSAQQNGSDAKGTLYAKGDMTICVASGGTGSLTVTQAYKHCIASKSILTVESGTLTLQNYLSNSTKTAAAGKNGLFGDQGIAVTGGTITFNGYGIISTSDVRKANGFKTDDDDYSDSWVKISGGTVNVTTYNGKGINAPCVYIEGGTSTFTVTGTTSYAEHTSSGSWYNADGVRESGTVKFAPEGIEGESVVAISGGTTIVSAPDDGVNVSNTGGNLTISDGVLYVKAKGDGLDSNGNIVISGGTTVISQTGGGNSPIDCGDNGYTFTVTGSGATVFAMGSNDMFSESIPSSTVSPMIYTTSLGSSSSPLGVDDIIGVTSPQTYAAAILVSSKLTSGTSYRFVKGGTISGTALVSDVYFPATVSGGSSTSVTATTQGRTSTTRPGRP